VHDELLVDVILIGLAVLGVEWGLVRVLVILAVSVAAVRLVLGLVRRPVLIIVAVRIGHLNASTRLQITAEPVQDGAAFERLCGREEALDLACAETKSRKSGDEKGEKRGMASRAVDGG
jgi:hypothetical protein